MRIFIPGWLRSLLLIALSIGAFLFSGWVISRGLRDVDGMPDGPSPNLFMLFLGDGAFLVAIAFLLFGPRSEDADDDLTDRS